MFPVKLSNSTPSDMYDHIVLYYSIPSYSLDHYRCLLSIICERSFSRTSVDILNPRSSDSFDVGSFFQLHDLNR